ncbi:hypothetical protein P4V41_05045 [Fictibacillus nanhaiensis]|uniref:hypothetical protein n=1 Tax=Fictibacillus nanhaiensis TaxID=742169 RepID=UPI002E1A7669|nr:hypothetical protein [Fictibacillus nanhaiensis]
MSLFNGSCCGHAAGTTHKKSKCGGAVCEMLEKLARRANNFDFCNGTQAIARRPEVRVISRGDARPLALSATDADGGLGTILQLIDFDAETGYALFGYVAAGTALPGITPTATILLDCRCLCGIICVTPTDAD